MVIHYDPSVGSILGVYPQPPESAAGPRAQTHHAQSECERSHVLALVALHQVGGLLMWMIHYDSLVTSASSG